MKQSARLILAPPVAADLARFYEINADPETNLFNPAGPMDRPTAEAAFQRMLSHWQEHGFGSWAIQERANPAHIIGFGGVGHRLYGTELKLNVGYRFDKDFWGKGYATELAQAAIHFGLYELDKKELFAIVRPQHVVSIKVLEKCGMQLCSYLDDAPGAPHSLVYKIEQ